MPPVVPPFLIGLVVAPLARRIVKPLMRGVIKASVGLAMEMKKAAHEAGEELHDLAAEVTAEMISAEISVSPDGEAKGAKARTPATAGANGGKTH